MPNLTPHRSSSGHDHAAMLAALDAHSRAMFGLPEPQAESSKQGRRRLSASSGSSASLIDAAYESHESDPHEAVSLRPTHKRITKDVQISTTKQVLEIVAAPNIHRSVGPTDAADKRAFMVSFIKPIHHTSELTVVRQGIRPDC
jgi:hypothetical protein